MRKLICISCPIGCDLTVTGEENDDTSAVKVEGNKCPRGIDYALAEITAPARIVTATVAVDSPDNPRLPVKTAAPFPKEDIPRLLDMLYGIVISDPVQRGDVILVNPLDTHIDVVATGRTEPIRK